MAVFVIRLSIVVNDRVSKTNSHPSRNTSPCFKEIFSEREGNGR
jgi:hypothetical protein